MNESVTFLLTNVQFIRYDNAINQVWHSWYCRILELKFHNFSLFEAVGFEILGIWNWRQFSVIEYPKHTYTKNSRFDSRYER